MAEHCKSLDSDLEAITNALEDEVRSRGWTSMTDYSLTDTVEITEDGYRVTLTKNLEPDAEGPPNEVQVSDTLPRDADPSKVAREIREMCDALERKAK